MASPALWDVRYGSRADLAATPAQTCAIMLSVALSATCKCLLLAHPRPRGATKNLAHRRLWTFRFSRLAG